MEYCLGSASDLLEGKFYIVFDFLFAGAPSEYSGEAIFSQTGILQMVEVVCLYYSILYVECLCL